MPHIMLFAGEYSGNIYGAAVARDLKRHCPGIRLSGTGCREMADEGVELLYECSSWGGIGFIEALRVLPSLLFVYLGLRRFILKEKPDALVFIDYPGFNMFLARLAHAQGIPTLYYFPPGKFARKPEEVAETATIITSIAAPFTFTYDVYERAGANVEYVGHPLADVLPSDLTRNKALEFLNFEHGTRIIGLLPGSRLREIRNHTPMLLRCAGTINKRHPDIRFVLPVPHLPGSQIDKLTRIVQSVAKAEQQRSGVDVTVVQGKAHATMAAAEILLISSGTATLEAVWFGTPMVIIYKASWLTEFLARNFFYKHLPKHFGLPNIIAGRSVVPEYIQRQFTLDNIAGEALRIIDDQKHRELQLKELDNLRQTMSKAGTSARVAEMVLELLGQGA